MTHSPQPSTATYPLRLVLAGISPMIWRRLLLSSETSIPNLMNIFRLSLLGAGSTGIASVFRARTMEWLIGVVSRMDRKFNLPEKRFLQRVSRLDHKLRKCPESWIRFGSC
jgi:hypothetical protein